MRVHTLGMHNDGGRDGLRERDRGPVGESPGRRDAGGLDTGTAVHPPREAPDEVKMQQPAILSLTRAGMPSTDNIPHACMLA